MPKKQRRKHEDMTKYSKWFEGQKTRTQNKNALNLRTFCEWINKSPEQLLKEYEQATDKKAWQRDRRKEIEAFYNHLISIGHKINSARSIPLGVLSFYKRHCEIVRGATKCFDAPQIPENEFIFTQEILRKAFYYADLEGQTLLGLATCLGYSSIDFLSLECEKLQNLIKEATDKGLDFIQFIGKSRAKTSVQPRSHLTTEAIQCLKDYLPLLEKQHNGKLPKYLWCNGKETSHITNEGLNKKLKRILRKANIETYGKTVRFHLFRKFLYSRLQAKNRDLAKVITAKKVSASDLTYIPDLDAECLRIFKETYKEIALNGDLTGKTKQQQTERIKELETQLDAMRTVMLGLFGLNRKQVEQLVAKQLEKEGVTIRGDKGVITPLEYVKTLSLQQLAKEFERIIKQQP